MFEMKDGYELKKNQKKTEYVVDSASTIIAKRCNGCSEIKELDL